MKALSFLVRLLVIGGIAATCSRSASAQSPPPLIRGDLAGTIGWQFVDKTVPAPYDYDNWHSSFFGAVGAGWYWTDHLKTELDFGVGTETTAYIGRPITVNGRPSFVVTESTFSRRTLGVSQQYQLFRNTWFHPHVAAGANITWEHSTDYITPIVVYDDVLRTGRVVEPARTVGPRTEVTVRPFLASGFKAYMTRRGFFRSDLRVAFRGGVDEVLVRFGFGIDF